MIVSLLPLRTSGPRYIYIYKYVYIYILLGKFFQVLASHSEGFQSFVHFCRHLVGFEGFCCWIVGGITVVFKLTGGSNA